MSHPTQWYGANKILKAPKGVTEEQVQDLHVFNNGVVSVSRWELSNEAITEIIESGCIFISCFSGQTQPPIFVGSEKEVREVAVDYGPVWKLNDR